MKITATQYAKALYEMTQEKPQAEVDLMVENFIRILQKNNQIRLTKNIIEKFSAIHNRDNGIIEATVTSASLLGEEVRGKIEIFIINKYAASKVILTNSVDKGIKGGIIIKVGDEMMDASIVKKINSLREALIK